MTPRLIIRRDELRAAEIIEADGYWFESCTFVDCVVIFRGSKPFGYAANCDFTGTQIEFEDAAALTLGTFAGLFPDGEVALAVLRTFASPNSVSN